MFVYGGGSIKYLYLLLPFWAQLQMEQPQGAVFLLRCLQQARHLEGLAGKSTLLGLLQVLLGRRVSLVQGPLGKLTLDPPLNRLKVVEAGTQPLHLPQHL